jgi:hypothetical protein
MHIEPQTAIEGEDITLTCRATRYLYSELQWFDPQNRTVTADVSPLRLDPYSVSLALTLRNVSRNGGTPAYRCGALNHFKHKSAHKTFVLNVDGKQSTRESRSGSTATTRGRAFGASQELFWL